MEDKKQVKEINASSMADIAFLLLIFFLVATTMNVDTGITRLLPPIPETEVIPDDMKVKERDLLPIFINAADQIMVTVPGQPPQFIGVHQLTNLVKMFVLNASNNDQLPDKEIKEIEMPDGSKWSTPVSKGVVSLNSAVGTSYDIYIQVQNELTRAYNEMRTDASRAKFGRAFTELDDAERKVITEAVPQQISEAEPKNTELGGR